MNMYKKQLTNTNSGFRITVIRMTEDRKINSPVFPLKGNNPVGDKNK